MADHEIKWQDLERIVRTVAETKFGGTARAEDIAGVRCDCVIHLNDGSVILIEISKESTIEKLRTDIAKFNTLRPHFILKNIFPKCFFITSREPTAALIEAGKANFVTVYSVLQFFNMMLGSDDYANERRRLAFGSAIDLYSGEPDQNKYVKVSYFADGGELYSTERIAKELEKGRTIVLIGDYGSGKSRCVKEVFEALLNCRDEHFHNPIAINLRENWGLRRASEIITRHFTEMGLSTHVADALKVAFSPTTIYLLDGFDEIGAQTWSDDPTKLVEIRRKSLAGVKDLISQARGGILIAGREHYFNNDAELITCLGLDMKSPLFLRCDQELTAQQFSEMLGRAPKTLPAWMPKKPLIATIIRDIDPAVVDKILETSQGEVDLWSLLIETFCEREAKINPILDASIIRELYTHIGRLSRTTQSPLGPISIKQINDAFEKTIGRPPTDESAIILQRLPGLSRIGAESLDRQFVDIYILDGLKAEDALSAYVAEEHLTEDWRNPIESFGALYIATSLSNENQARGALAFVRRHRDAPNRVLLSDLLAGLFLVDRVPVDFGGLEFHGGRFFHVSLGDTSVQNLYMKDCIFDHLDITNAEPGNITIQGSVVMRMSGVTSKDYLPLWVSDCIVEDFQSVNTLTAIREAGLTVAQTFLLSSLRKLFLQPGGGRKESSMYKGYGDSTTKKTCEKVIRLLVREGFCQKYKGNTGPIYVPERSFTSRVKVIMSQLTMSKDDLWLQASKIK
jgi:hypothetical protein